MIRVYLALGIAAALSVGGFYTGYQFSQGRIAQKQLKTASEVIENDNQDKIAITNHITEVKTIQGISERAINKIEIIDNTKPCPIAELVRVQRETYTAFPELFFQQYEPLPSAANSTESDTIPAKR